MKKLVIALTLVMGSGGAAWAENYAGSWDQAKKRMWGVYKDNRFDQYCGCPLGSRNAPDLVACGYEPRKNPSRAARTEIEHIVPAENLGRSFSCWKEGGREHCNQTDQKFRNAHNDLHNLVPVVGEVNGDRSNFRFDELPQGYGQYGQCKFKVDFDTRRAEPPPHLKGDVARIHYYMRDQHGLKLSAAQERLFAIWDKNDPVSDWEQTRDKRIKAIQGNSNPYVSGRVALPPRTPQAELIQARAGGSQELVGQSKDCSVKTCKQMASCTEAMYQLEVCGQTSLDRDGDGVPCESLCRN